MPPNMKIFLFITLLVFICSSSGSSYGTNDALKDTTNPHNEAISQMKARKLIGVNAMLDYYEAGSNPVHDPPKGRSGGRGGNNN